MEHIPDVGIQDIEEEDEEEIESENELDEEDAPKDVTFNQDGVASDETDMEPFSKSGNVVELFGLLRVLSGLLWTNSNQLAQH